MGHGLTWLRLLTGGLAVVIGCGGPPPAPGTVIAGRDAQLRRVDSYEIGLATANDLTVELRGGRPARLRVHVDDGIAVQRIDPAAGPSFTLRTSWSRIEVEGSGPPHPLAERVGETWVAREPLAVAEAAWLELLLAVDVDLAVQGTSMVFGGRMYAWCTSECSRAVRCARRDPFEGCAGHIATCGACLEQEP